MKREPEEQTSSLWMETVSLPTFAGLERNAEADVCIIGAGLAGLMTAYLLAREGRSIMVIEDGAIASGQTQRTTAHLSNAIDDRYLNIERWHGEDGARAAAQSHTEAIDLLESIARQEQISCDFERLDGYLFLAPEHSIGLLEDELAAAHRAGLAEVALVDRNASPGFELGPSLRFPQQGQFHVLKFLDGLLRAIQR
ncbi:MAG TPA: FAD-dependent oxidoreductase, partial [bacterium]|nr:FAD-dependent oxidoreductase [bacterium]